MGLSKQRQKYIQSLQNKKFRQQYGAFLVEGRKSLEELLNSSFEIEELVLSEKAAEMLAGHACTRCAEAELSKLSYTSTNTFGLAVARCKPNAWPTQAPEGWILVVDKLNDPGNLGTIIRTADWYGIRQIVCSADTVDFYNPKAIMATMGSFCRVDVFYVDLPVFLAATDLPVFGAVLDGRPLHDTLFPEQGILLIGSESHGISPALKPLIHVPVTIPRLGQAESLNAGVAAAVILDNIVRTKSGI